MNYATLAPPITKENAAEYARRATIARERNRAARRDRILASPDDHARKEVEKQIQKVLRWMEKAEDKKEYARLCAVLDRLWSKAYAEVRPTKRSIGRPSMSVVRGDWQPVNEPPQRYAGLRASGPTPAPSAPVISASVVPVPAPAVPSDSTLPAPPVCAAPATPESMAIPPGPGASPQPEPQPLVPSSVSPPMAVELKAVLSALYKRPAGMWTDAEGRWLMEVAKRRGVLTEIEVIRNCHRRLTPEKKSSFPTTASALLENWDRVLAYARQHMPR
jgi:hypothetical protein